MKDRRTFRFLQWKWVKQMVLNNGRPQNSRIEKETRCYDFLDKLIGFKLSDIFYAAFKINFENTHDKRSLTFANLIKYGTSNEKEILMLRYGLSLDDISVLEPYILSIDTGGISVSPDYYDLPLDIRKPLERFV